MGGRPVTAACGLHRNSLSICGRRTLAEAHGDWGGARASANRRGGQGVRRSRSFDQPFLDSGRVGAQLPTRAHQRGASLLRHRVSLVPIHLIDSLVLRISWNRSIRLLRRQTRLERDTNVMFVNISLDLDRAQHEYRVDLTPRPLGVDTKPAGRPLTVN